MRSRKLALAAAVAALAACRTPPSVRPDAFDRGQRVALVAIQSPPKVTGWSSVASPVPELDAAPILAEIRPVLVEALSRNPHFRLVPEAKVFAAPTFAAHAAAPAGAGLVSAPGYKPVTDESLYPRIAREAGADMAMSILLSLVYRGEDGAAAVVLTVGAIDAKGRGVWKGGAAVVADRSVDVRTAAPKARLDAYRDAVRRAMEQLDESLDAQLAFERASGQSRY